MRFYATDTVVKTISSEELKAEVDEWLKKGNKIKDCTNTGLAPNFNCGGKLDKEPLVKGNNRTLGAFNQRVS